MRQHRRAGEKLFCDFSGPSVRLRPGGHPNSPTRGHFKLPHLNTVSRG
jgi:hypothetical protein